MQESDKLGEIMRKQWKSRTGLGERIKKPDDLNLDVQIPYFQSIGAKRRLSVSPVIFRIIIWSEKRHPACNPFQKVFHQGQNGE
jgi:hypothetical protein